jgi:flagellar protein FliL
MTGNPPAIRIHESGRLNSEGPMAKKEKAKKGEKPEDAEAEKPAKGKGAKDAKGAEGAEVAEGAEGEAPAKKKMAGKTLVLFIILPAVLVLGGGGAAAAMPLGGGKKAEAHATEGEHGEAAEGEHGEKKKPEKKPEKKDDHGASGGEHGAAAAPASTADVGSISVGEDGNPSYYNMPKLIVNLAGNGGASQLLELALTLEASDASAFDHVPAEMPRLRDQFQSFLRELRVEDLNGSAGSYRLRLELLRRFNAVMAPAKADAVLIESFLVMEQ